MQRGTLATTVGFGWLLFAVNWATPHGDGVPVQRGDVGEGMRNYRWAMAHLVAFILLATALVTIAAGAAQAVEGACSLVDGTVVNGSSSVFIRSDFRERQAELGPFSVSIPTGRYAITLESFDDHEIPDNQTNERWFIEAWNGKDLVFTSNAIADLPENRNTLKQQVNADVALPAFTSIRIKHAAFPDNSSPNSVFALCVSFARVATTPIGLVDPATGIWHLRDEQGLETQFFYGNPGDLPFMGDWDCDGTDTPGLYRQSDGFVYLRNANSQGNAHIRFFFGNPGDVPLAGDFNNDGCDTVSIYRPSEARFYIINELGANDGGLGAADFSFLFGNTGDKPVVGDWDADGIDEIGLHRESTGLFYFRNTLSTGIADDQFFFGDPGDRFVAGDWGIVDGVDTPAVFRPSNATFYFRHTNTQGNADDQITWGESGWLPVAGDFTLP